MLSKEDVFLEGPQEAGEEEVVVSKDAKKKNSFTRSGGKQRFMFLWLKVNKNVFECVHPPRSRQLPQKASMTQNMRLLMSSVMICTSAGLSKNGIDPAIVRRWWVISAVFPGKKKASLCSKPRSEGSVGKVRTAANVLEKQ